MCGGCAYSKIVHAKIQYLRLLQNCYNSVTFSLHFHYIFITKGNIMLNCVKKWQYFYNIVFVTLSISTLCDNLIFQKEYKTYKFGMCKNLPTFAVAM